MTIKTEGVHAGEVLLSEANGTRSREQVVINAGAGRLPAGTVIAQITAANAGTATAGTNTGDAAIGTITVSNAAITGTYSVEITKADGGAGKPAEFVVTDPQGATAAGVAGVKFSGLGIEFTLTDAVAPDTPAALADSWTIAVVEGIGEWVAYDADGTNDGRRSAGGVLYAAVDATLNDVRAQAILRDAEVKRALLTGLDAGGEADLLALGIVAR